MLVEILAMELHTRQFKTGESNNEIEYHVLRTELCKPLD